MKWIKLRGETKKEQWPRLDADDLVNEIWQAHHDWQIAQKKLDYAMDRDQIDYAIYIMEAAEKRYDMLLRQAKQQLKLKISQKSEFPNAAKESESDKPMLNG